jgi:hypothetical protein
VSGWTLAADDDAHSRPVRARVHDRTDDRPTRALELAEHRPSLDVPMHIIKRRRQNLVVSRHGRPESNTCSNDSASDCMLARRSITGSRRAARFSSPFCRQLARTVERVGLGLGPARGLSETAG